MMSRVERMKKVLVDVDDTSQFVSNELTLSEPFYAKHGT